MTQLHTILFVNAHGESGTVSALRQAGSSPYIRIPQELLRILNHLYTDIGHTGAVEQFRHRNRCCQLVFHHCILRSNIRLIAVDGDLQPVIHRLNILQFFPLRNLGQNTCLHIGSNTDIQPIGLYDRHRLHKFIGPHLRLGACQKVFQADIAFHLAGYDMCPAVDTLQHLAGGILGHLAHKLAVCSGNGPHIQVALLNIGNTDIGIAPEGSLGLLREGNELLVGKSCLKKGCYSCCRHNAAGSGIRLNSPRREHHEQGCGKTCQLFCKSMKTHHVKPQNIYVWLQICYKIITQ